MSELRVSRPSNKLRVSVIQTDLCWQQPELNRRHLEDKITPLVGLADLIVLPEMFTTGFSMVPEIHAEAESGVTLTWLIALSLKTGAALAGSFAVKLASPDGEELYANRLYLVDGHEVQYYDKKHLFRMANEEKHYKAGGGRKVFSLRGWRLLPLVCYDLRFPVFSRNCNDYDAVICVANWPKQRRHPWRTLLQARAIENLSYVIGVNRVGEDGNGLRYSGDSMVVGFDGEPLVGFEPGVEGVGQAVLDLSLLAEFRTEFPAELDRDHFIMQ